MTISSTVLIETFAATLHALSRGHTQTSPQDFPVERAYRKYIFNLEKEENEDELEVVIHARMAMIFDDCNLHTPPESTLIKAPIGYHFLDRPRYITTLKGCSGLKVEVCNIKLSNNVFPYCSETPIVIHAINDMHVWQEVRPKNLSTTMPSSELNKE